MVLFLWVLEYRAGAVTRSVRKQGGCARVWRSDAQITGVYRIPLLELRKNPRTGTVLVLHYQTL